MLKILCRVFALYTFSLLIQNIPLTRLCFNDDNIYQFLLPPANEVRGKIMLSQVCFLSTGRVGFPACITGHMTSIGEGGLVSQFASSVTSRGLHPEGVCIHGRGGLLPGGGRVCIQGDGSAYRGRRSAYSGVCIQGRGSAYSGVWVDPSRRN